MAERTFAWLMNSRRLTRNYEALPATSEAMIRWSMVTRMNGPIRRRRPGSPERAARDHAALKPLPPTPYLVAERQLRHVDTPAAASRSPMFAAATATTRSRRRQSVTMCRLRPGTFFPPS